MAWEWALLFLVVILALNWKLAKVEEERDAAIWKIDRLRRENPDPDDADLFPYL